MQYSVRTLSGEHRIESMVVEATNENDARQQVEAKGLFAGSITPVHAPWLAIWRTELSTHGKLPLVLFSQELLALLHAGLSIVEALEALLEKEGNASTRAILNRLLLGLLEGKRFSNVLADQPNVFPPLYIGIVRAAEGTSNLPRSLSRFVDYQQRIDAVRSKIVSAAIYPLILLAVGGCVSLFLIGYVVPKFADVYRGAGRNLPWLSERLLDWGQYAGAHAPQMLTGALTGIVAAVIVLRQLIATGGLLRWVTRLPAIGERTRIYELSRLYLTLGMLLEGGIPIVPAMETVRSMVKGEVKTGLELASKAIQSGAPLSAAFEANRLTTPVSLRMLRVGERSGELGAMLTQAAAFYDGEINRWIDRFTNTFEPLLMVAIGLVVGAIVVLLYMPIFDLAGSLS